MTKNARVWIGITLLVILAFNYSILGLPLYIKAMSLNDRSTVLLMNKIKSGKTLKSPDDEYILDIFRHERAAINKKLLVLNSITVSIVIVIGSWMAFGLVTRRKEN